MEDKQIRLAAAWIYRNKKGPDYWTPLVFLQPFLQKDGLLLSYQDADRVFQALENKGFIKKKGNEFVDVQGFEVQKYEIEWGSLVAFREYSDIGFVEKSLPEPVYRFLKRWEAVLITCLIIIATSFIESFVDVFGARFGEFAAKLLPG